MYLWPENEVWERLCSLNKLLAKIGAKHAYDLNLKSLTMSGFAILFSFISAHSTHFHFPFRRNVPLTAASLLPDCGPSLAPLRIGDLGERFISPNGSERGLAAKRFFVHFELKMKSLAMTSLKTFPVPFLPVLPYLYLCYTTLLVSAH